MISKLKAKVKDILKVTPNDNVEYNVKIWDDYAKNWDYKTIEVENEQVDKEKRAEYLKFIGNEWGVLNDANKLIEDYLLKYVDNKCVVAEIGIGGGRIANIVAPKINKLVGFDVANEMLKKASFALSEHKNIDYVHLTSSKFDSKYEKTFDMVYSFDVFVHLDLHNIWAYFKEIKKVLKDDGKVFIHTANLNTPGGWDRFKVQERYWPGGFYFITPQTINILAEKAGYRIIKNSEVDESNFYLNRDYLFVMENIK